MTGNAGMGGVQGPGTPASAGGGATPAGPSMGGATPGLPDSSAAAQNVRHLLSGGAPDGVVPSHRTHVWSWLKAPAQRVIMPTWLAITVYHDIFSWRALDDYELAHELCHVRQWNANGVMYPWRYYQASRAAKAAGKDQYRDNAFEAEAYGIEDALRVARAGDHPA